MCVKKQRKVDAGSVASRMGLQLYNRFYQMNTAQVNSKTIDQFIDSRYYTSFIKFARRLMDLRPIDQDRFVDYVFRNGYKERDWCKDKVYESYIVDLLLKEPADRGLERSIKTMEIWAEKYEKPLTEFFICVAPSEATHLIKMGKISPWVLYLSESGGILLESLSDEQVNILEPIINIKAWFAKFERQADDKTFVQEVLYGAHI